MLQRIFTTYDLLQAMGKRGTSLLSTMKELHMVNMDFGFPPYNKTLDGSAVFTIGDPNGWHARVGIFYRTTGDIALTNWTIGQGQRGAPSHRSGDTPS